MGLTVHMDYSKKEVRDYMESEIKKNQQRVIATLQYVGEQVVNEIRSGDISSWNDQTGNLRSSIGYLICVDNEPIIQGEFKQVAGGTEGVVSGPAYAREVAAFYPQGIVLIVVAGMEYASYVEKMENKVVLAQGELRAKELIAEFVKKFKERYSNDSK